MANTIRSELRAAGVLTGLIDYRYGSAIEVVQGVAPTVTGTGAAIKRVRGRFGCNSMGTGLLNYGNNAAWNLSAAGTVIVMHTPMVVPAAGNYDIVYGKELWGADQLGHACYFVGSQVRLVLADVASRQAVLITTTGYVTGVPNMYAMAWNGTNVWAWLNGSPGPTPVAAQTRVPDASGQNLYVLNQNGGGYPNKGGYLHQLAFCNIPLIGSQINRWWEEFLSEGLSPDVAKRNIYFQIPSGPDYAMADKALSTTFAKRADGKLADNSPNNYAGTITGVVTPGPGGEGATLADANARVSWGDVTALNAPSKFSIVDILKSSASTWANKALWRKHLDGTHTLFTSTTTAAAASVARLQVINGVTTCNADTTATPMRAGAAQYVEWIYDSAGATDADKLKLEIDGEAYTLSFLVALPAMPDLTGGTLYNGYPTNSEPATHSGFIAKTNGGSVADRRAAYLKNFGSRVLWRETFADVPVTLAASVAAGQMIGQWRIISGTWKCSEDSAGRRYLEQVTGGPIITQQPLVHGTLDFVFQKANLGTQADILFNASLPAAWNTANQNGYLFRTDTNERLILGVVTNGVFVTNLFYTAMHYITSGVPYHIWINRRPSDGRFTCYIQGGAYVTPTLVAVAFSTNPTAAETTYMTSQWMVLGITAPDKLLMYSSVPGERFGITWWQGVLTPSECP